MNYMPKCLFLVVNVCPLCTQLNKQLDTDHVLAKYYAFNITNIWHSIIFLFVYLYG